MAKISYNGSDADYAIIKFRCKCGDIITTGLIPVKEHYDLDKYENSFIHGKPFVCPKCNKKHVIRFYDNMYDAYCEIPSLPNNKDVIYLHEIPYEYAKGYDNALIDFIQEIVIIRDIVEKINKIETIEKNLFVKMTFSYVISLMDAFLYNTFAYNIRTYDLFKREFVRNYNERNKGNNAEERLKRIEHQSFQNLEKISIPYYKDAFGIDIKEDKIIQNAIHKRNAIIHNNGRDTDNYSYKITLSHVKELTSHVESLIRYVNMEMFNVVFEKIIWPNFEEENCQKFKNE